jgi:hypothetical protein
LIRTALNSKSKTPKRNDLSKTKTSDAKYVNNRSDLKPKTFFTVTPFILLAENNLHFLIFLHQKLFKKPRSVTASFSTALRIFVGFYSVFPWNPYYDKFDPETRALVPLKKIYWPI